MKKCVFEYIKHICFINLLTNFYVITFAQLQLSSLGQLLHRLWSTEHKTVAGCNRGQRIESIARDTQSKLLPSALSSLGRLVSIWTTLPSSGMEGGGKNREVVACLTISCLFITIIIYFFLICWHGKWQPSPWINDIDPPKKLQSVAVEFSGAYYFPWFHKDVEC